MKETVALFISDLHVGSRWAIWHPNYTFKDGLDQGSTWGLNGIQERIWKYWQDFTQGLKKKNLVPDYIFLLGDLIDGPQRRGHGNEAVTQNLNEQAGCALQLLRMILKKDSTIIRGLVGSDYHDERYYNVNEGICTSYGGKFSGITGIFNIGSHRFRMYHGKTQAYIYLEMIMGRRRMFAHEAMARNKLPEFEGIIMGHLHRWIHIKTMFKEDMDFHVVLLPGWQGQTTYEASIDPDKIIPEIGAVIGRFNGSQVDFQCEFRYPTPIGGIE